MQKHPTSRRSTSRRAWRMDASSDDSQRSACATSRRARALHGHRLPHRAGRLDCRPARSVSGDARPHRVTRTPSRPLARQPDRDGVDAPFDAHSRRIAVEPTIGCRASIAECARAVPPCLVDMRFTSSAHGIEPATLMRSIRAIELRASRRRRAEIDGGTVRSDGRRGSASRCIRDADTRLSADLGQHRPGSASATGRRSTRPDKRPPTRMSARKARRIARLRARQPEPRSGCAADPPVLPVTTSARRQRDEGRIGLEQILAAPAADGRRPRFGYARLVARAEQIRRRRDRWTRSPARRPAPAAGRRSSRAP